MTFPQDTTGTVVESPDLIDAYCTSGTSPTGKVLPSPCVKHSFSVPSLSRTPADEPAPVVHCELVGLVHLPTVVVLGGISAGRHVCSSENDSTDGGTDSLGSEKPSTQTSFVFWASTGWAA